MSVSVVLATYNEESHLSACLSSIADIADEIIVVDGRSTDKTVEIADKFHAQIKIADNPPIFHINKQKAVDLSSKDWILQLDADEVVPDNLKSEIVAVAKAKSNRYNGYYLARKNYFLGRWLKKGGQYPDQVVRLFRRGFGRFPGESVHEQIVINGEIGYLKNPLLHYPYATLGEYFVKALRYGRLLSNEITRKKETKNISFYLKYIFILPLYTFINIYFRHFGFMDSIHGLLFAFLSSLQFPIAIYYMLHE